MYCDRVSFVLLGFDDINNRNTEFTNNLESFQDIHSCQEYVKKVVENQRLILIVSEIFAKELIPCTHEYQHIISIYVYCFDRKTHLDWLSSKFTKVKDVVTDIDELLHQLKAHYNLQKEIINESLPIKIFDDSGKSISELNGKFINFQILIDCLLRLPSIETDKNELITFYQNKYKENSNQLKHLNEFRESYSSDKAIWWYTRESFFYRIINTTLRSDDIQIMFLLRSFIFDIQQQLEKYQFQTKLKVYRSQIMSKNEFQTLRQCKNQLISVNSFFSSTTDRAFAIHMLGDRNSIVNWERILFEIDADPQINKTKPFADISQLSYFPNENEILFIMGTIFRIEKIFCNENQIWIVQMTLCGEDENHLNDILKEKKKQIGKGQTNLFILGKFLHEIGEFDLAEQYFKRLLNELSLNDLLCGDVYDELAKVLLQNKKSDESIQWRQKYNEFKRKNLLSYSTKSLENLIHIPKSNLDLYEEIGYGGFGKVYRAKLLTDHTIIAVKTLHSTHLNRQEEIVFLNELLLLYRIRHPNIITFYGACLDKDHYALVMEYMSLGSLYYVLHEQKLEFSWSIRLSIALQAAKGINYLHQSQPEILHRDIKSPNLLLENHHTDYYLVKICDFGMAKTRDQTTCQIKENMSFGFTLPWTAPEILRMKSHSTKSDIYSLGIVYWELANNEIPYDGHKTGHIKQFVSDGDRLDISDGTPVDFRIIIEKCWAHQLDDRPTSIHLLQMLNECNVKQYAKTIAGGNSHGDGLNQLQYPYEIYVHYQQQSIYIADLNNHRIVKWKLGENSGQIVAGGNGIDELNSPTDVIVDENNKSLIICDSSNRRVIRWSLENQQDKQIIIEDIDCARLMMNKKGDLFVSEYEKHEVKRWRKDEIGGEGTIVAGGNGRGDKLNQLDHPASLFIDRQDTIYISDYENHRVIKWQKDAKEGIIVAGGHGQGNNLNQLSGPEGLIVNEVGDVYIADSYNHRIVCWPSGSTEGRVVIGGNGQGEKSNQLNLPIGLSFDIDNNLYVVDCLNHRIQCFSINQN